MSSVSASSRSRRSLGVSAGIGSIVSGRLMPLWFETLPPTMTVASTRVVAHGIGAQAHLAVVDQHVGAGFERGKDFADAEWEACSASAERSACSSTILAPSFSCGAAALERAQSAASAPANRPGWRWAVRPRPRPRAPPRPSPSDARCSVWLMLMRNTSAPASNSARMPSGALVAGPSVATNLGLARAPQNLSHVLRDPINAAVQSARFSVQSIESPVSTWKKVRRS